MDKNNINNILAIQKVSQRFLLSKQRLLLSKQFLLKRFDPWTRIRISNDTLASDSKSFDTVPSTEMIASTFLSKRFSNFCSKSKTGDDCRVCRKSFAPEEASRICCECQHKVCEDCACYSTTTNSDDPVSVSLSLFVQLVHLIICRNNSFHLFKILPHAVFQRISLEFSPMKPRRILSLFDI